MIASRLWYVVLGIAVGFLCFILFAGASMYDRAFHEPPALPQVNEFQEVQDALSKGIGRGNVWDELRTVALALAGTPVLPLPRP